MNVVLKKFYETILNYKQKRITRLYKSEGLTDRVLKKQTKINEKRDKLGLPDRYEMIYKRYIQ